MADRGRPIWRSAVLQWRVPQIHRRCQRRAENRMDAGAPQRQPLPRQSRPIERPTRAARDPQRNNMRCRRRTRSAPRGSIARAPAPPAAIATAGRAAGLLLRQRRPAATDPLAATFRRTPAPRPWRHPVRVHMDCFPGQGGRATPTTTPFRIASMQLVCFRASKSTRSGAISQLPWRRCHAIQRYD